MSYAHAFAIIAAFALGFALAAPFGWIWGARSAFAAAARTLRAWRDSFPGDREVRVAESLLRAEPGSAHGEIPF